MTDTGQIPGAGQPESAGAQPEGQPDTPATATAPYTYEGQGPAGGTPADDDNLLMPGSQGAWGEPQMSASAASSQGQQVSYGGGRHAQQGQQGQHAQQVAYGQQWTEQAQAEGQYASEAAPDGASAPVNGHVPGPHETDGRDSGAIDCSSVRSPAPEQASTPPSPSANSAPSSANSASPSANSAPRRPLHLGPPEPEQSGTVRPLSDRGRANPPAKARTSGKGPAAPGVGPAVGTVPPANPPANPVPGQGSGVQAPQGAQTVPPAPGQPGVQEGQFEGQGQNQFEDQDQVQGGEPQYAAEGNAPEYLDASVGQSPDALPDALPGPQLGALPPHEPWGTAQEPDPQPQAAVAAEAATAQPQAQVDEPQPEQLPAEQLPGEQPQAAAEGPVDEPVTPVAAPDVPVAGPMPEPEPEAAAELQPEPRPEPQPEPQAVTIPAQEANSAADAVSSQEADAQAPSIPAQQRAEPALADDGEGVQDTAPQAEGVEAEEETPSSGHLWVSAPGSSAVEAAEATEPVNGQQETAGSAEPAAPVSVPEWDEAPQAADQAAVEPEPVPEPAPEPEPEPVIGAPEVSGAAEDSAEVTGTEPESEAVVVPMPETHEPAPPISESVPAPAPEPTTVTEDVLVQDALTGASDVTDAGAPEVPGPAAGEETPVPVDASAGAPAEAASDVPPKADDEPQPQQPEAETETGTDTAPESEPVPVPVPAPHADAETGVEPELVPAPDGAAGEQPAAGPAANPEPGPGPGPAPDAAPDPETVAGAVAETSPDPAAAPPEEPAGDPAADPAAEEPLAPLTAPAAGFEDAERETVHRLMRERRDIRNGFRSDPIPHEVLLRVLEAAHTAPSVGHSQPWDFVVIRSEETRRAMHELAQHQAEAYAKSLPKARAKQFKQLKIEAILDTPVNIVVTADPTRGGRHTLGRHTQPQMAPYSSALAVENLWLAARAEGLGVGWVSFFDEREMVRALELPEHLEVVAYLCVGYVDEFPPEPELAQAGWSKRRPLSWVVHEESYGRRVLPGAEPHDLLAETMSAIRPLDAKALGEAWERQKRMTKPPGALGMLEIISAQLCGLSRKCPPPLPEPAAVAVFAGDHGVHAQGVTPWPQEVTGQMVANFLGGGAVCNAFANQVGAEVCVIDVGVAGELPAMPGLLPRKVRAGTADMTVEPALTREEAMRGIEVGIETARDLVSAGNKALLTGEMGIANTTASAALISACTGTDPAEVTGRGTGINDETHSRKVDVVRRALELHNPDPADPVGMLAAVGGLEQAAIVGLILGGASLRTPVILDGVSAGAAALVARCIAPEALAACIAGHRSAEPGHVAALTKLGLRPLVDLDLRLGEGTGALLALPMVQSAARAMHEVATFDAAGVTDKS